MKKLILILALLSSCAALAQSPPALVAHTTSNGSTSSAINMTGADFIAVCVNYAYLPPTVTDSLGNTYVQAAQELAAGYTYTKLYVSINPTVSSSMTFTPSVSGWPMTVMGFSGVAGPVDQTNGNNNNYSPLSTGSITPANNHELVISCSGGTSSGSPTSSVSGVTFLDGVALNGSPGQGYIADGYQIQSTSTAVNATWTHNLNAAAMLIASFYSVESPSTLVATSTNLPEGFNGTVYTTPTSIYSNCLAATGGVSPYSWAVSSGSLPTGLSLNSSTGCITGTPTVTQSATNVTFKVTDSTSPTAQTATTTIPMTVSATVFSAGAGTCTGTALNGTQYQAFGGCTLAASGGATPYAFYFTNTVSSLATIVNGSTTVTIPAGTNQLQVGMVINEYGTLANGGIPYGATITAIPTSTTITLSAPATASITLNKMISLFPWANPTYATLPEGMVLNQTTGAITGSYIGGEGAYGQQFYVQDNLGTYTTFVFTFAITGDNVTPCLPWAGSIFNTNISSLPVDTSPAAPLTDYLSSHIQVLFGSNAGINSIPNGIPIITVPSTQPLVAVSTGVYQSYFTEGPWPWYTPIEATANSHVAGGDAHSVILQTPASGNDCAEWGMWQSFNGGIPGTNGSWFDDSNFYLPNIGSTSITIPLTGTFTNGSAVITGISSVPASILYSNTSPTLTGSLVPASSTVVPFTSTSTSITMSNTYTGTTTTGSSFSVVLNAYAMPYPSYGSTDAAGLPLSPLLVTADEVIGSGTPSAPTGAVLHPIRFTVSGPVRGYVWPATDQAGSGSCSGGYSDYNFMLKQSNPPTSCANTVPYGEFYRVKSSFSNPSCISTSPQAAIVLTAMRTYGIIMADGGESIALIGTPDPRWNDTDLHCLTNILGSDLEPVNVSSIAVHIQSSPTDVAGSYQVTGSTPASASTRSGGSTWGNGSSFQ